MNPLGHYHFDLQQLETQLTEIASTRMRGWGKKQNDYDDQLTRFVYASNYDELEYKTLANLAAREPDATEARKQELLNYCFTRWFSHRVAKGQEQLFCEAGARANPNHASTVYDFTLNIGGQQIQVDHKGSVWPKEFKQTPEQVRADPTALMLSLIGGASTGGRYNHNNKIWVVSKAADGNHTRFKASFSVIEPAVREWMKAPQMRTITVDGQTILAGVILIEE